jgi:hypothetical protein
LALPVRIEGDDNLKVLKALRSSFCAYEDKGHNLGSYINLNDWGEKHINKGRLYSIEQSDVDLLHHLISIAHKYVEKKFDEKKIMVGAFCNRRWWSLDRAIKYYEQNDKDGERHPTLFKIKNNLSEEDCDRFAEWLGANHPSKMHHWKSHKRIAS